MHTMRIKAALIYNLTLTLRTIGIFLLVMVCVYIGLGILGGALVIGAPGVQEGSVSVSGLDFSSLIFCFVVGIVSVREDLRMFLQNGCGRRTVFIAQAAMALMISLILSLVNLLLSEGFHQLVQLFQWNIETSSIFEGGILAGFLLMFLGCFCALFLGLLISMIFYRVPKPWKLVVSIGGPVLLFAGLPVLFSLPLAAPAAAALMNLFAWSIASVANGCLTLLSCTVLFSVLGYLLLRHAPLKAQ